MKLLAGVPYTVPVALPVAGQILYATLEANLYRVRYLGTDGQFDGRAIHKFVWLTGPNKGETQRSYARSFWRKPTRTERLGIWDQLTSYEQDKLRAGAFPGLRPEHFGR